MEGWIKVHRSLQEHPDYFAEPFTRIMAIVDMNLIANHKDGYIRQRGILVELKRGQIGVSREKLAERWKWSPGKVTRFLCELEKSGMIVQQKSNVINCITMVNYDKEQSNDTPDSTANDTANDTASGTPNDTANDTANSTANRTPDNTANSTANDTADGRQTDANKNDKNSKNDKNTTHTTITELDSLTARTYARARGILDWLSANLPAVQRMPEPLTEAQAVWLVRKYDDRDIRRIFAEMDNKKATESNKNAYTTFVSFARYDEVLKAQGKRKLYTYNEKCDLIHSRKYTEDDFVGHKIDGRIFWEKKTEALGRALQ